MKVSFDFDSTLDMDLVQQYARELVDRGLEVWICTSRLSDHEAPTLAWNLDLYSIADNVGIKREHIQFCSMADKYEFFKGKDYIWHLDDDVIELNMINSFTKTIGVSVYGNNVWRNKCERILKTYK